MSEEYKYAMVNAIIVYDKDIVKKVFLELMDKLQDVLIDINNLNR